MGWGGVGRAGYGSVGVGVGVGYGRVMVEVGYGRGRVGNELSKLGSRWFVHACYKCTVFVSIFLSEGRDFPKHDYEISK